MLNPVMVANGVRTAGRSFSFPAFSASFLASTTRERHVTVEHARAVETSCRSCLSLMTLNVFLLCATVFMRPTPVAYCVRFVLDILIEVCIFFLQVETQVR